MRATRRSKPFSNIPSHEANGTVGPEQVLLPAFLLNLFLVPEGDAAGKRFRGFGAHKLVRGPSETQLSCGSQQAKGWANTKVVLISIL